MVDVPLMALLRSLWSGSERPSDDDEDDVRLLAAAYFWQDPRIASRPARSPLILPIRKVR